MTEKRLGIAIKRLGIAIAGRRRCPCGGRWTLEAAIFGAQSPVWLASDPGRDAAGQSASISVFRFAFAAAQPAIPVGAAHRWYCPEP